MRLHEILAGPTGPLLIFFLRIIDVSMATVRTLLVVRNAKIAVPVIGFFEVLIWIAAVGTAIQNLTSPLHILGYAGGFATGNVVGLFIEERMALGLATVRSVLGKEAGQVADALRREGISVTEFPGRGDRGRVRMVYSVVPRRHVAAVVTALEQADPRAFIVIDEPRHMRRGNLFQRRRK